MNRDALQKFIGRLDLRHIALAAIFGGANETPLDEVREQNFANWHDLQLFLERPDILTESVYEGTGNGMVIFPHLDGGDGAIDYIGRQTSKYHVETISQHSLLTTENLISEGLAENLAVPLGLLHDVGKKYTGAINKHGEMTFYGHAELSAYIAARWLWRFAYGNKQKDAKMKGYRFKECLWQIVAAIYGHMKFKTEDWKHNPNRERAFRAELGQFYYDTATSRYASSKIDPDPAAAVHRYYGYDVVCFVGYVIELIELLDAADIGCATGEEVNLRLEDMLFCSGRIEMYW